MGTTHGTLSAARAGGAPGEAKVARPWAGIEPVVLELAASQHGVATRAQLIGLGASPYAIDRRIASGWLVVVHRGVYRIGPVLAPRAKEMAAVLACGAGAAVSHVSAGALWRQIPGLAEGRGRTAAWPVGVHVSVEGRQPRHPGIRVHRLQRLLPDEVARLEGIPLTTPERTLVDMAPLLDVRPLERAVAETLALRLTTPERILAIVSRYPGRPGARLLGDILGSGTDPARTRSEAEEVFLGLVRRARLPAPRTNDVVLGYEVDAHWPAERVVVEIDGYAFHSSRPKLERDHRRDAELTAAGYTVLRFTWTQLRDESEVVLAQLVRALDRRR